MKGLEWFRAPYFFNGKKLQPTILVPSISYESLLTGAAAGCGHQVAAEDVNSPPWFVRKVTTPQFLSSKNQLSQRSNGTWTVLAPKESVGNQGLCYLNMKLAQKKLFSNSNI